MGDRKLPVHVRIVVATIFDFMTEENWGVEIANLRVDARAKVGKGGGGGEKKYACPISLRTLANGAPDWGGLREVD